MLKISNKLNLRISVFNEEKKLFTCMSNTLIDKTGQKKISFKINKNFFYSGTYSIKLGLFSHMPIKKIFETSNNVLFFDVENKEFIVPGYSSEKEILNFEFL